MIYSILFSAQAASHNYVAELESELKYTSFVKKGFEDLYLWDDLQIVGTIDLDEDADIIYYDDAKSFFFSKDGYRGPYLDEYHGDVTFFEKSNFKTGPDEVSLVKFLSLIPTHKHAEVVLKYS